MIIFSERLDSTGWGNKIRSLISGYVLSILAKKPLFVDYNLYHSCFTPPSGVFRTTRSLRYPENSLVLIKPGQLSDLRHIDLLPPLLIGHGFSFLKEVFSIYGVTHDYSLELLSHAKLLFASPTSRLNSILAAEFPPYSNILAFQFRAFVDSQNENTQYFSQFLKKIPSIHSLPVSNKTLCLYLSDRPKFASLMYCNHAEKRFPAQSFVDSQFSHTGYCAPLRRGSFFEAMEELFRRFIQLLLTTLYILPYPTNPNPISATISRRFSMPFSSYSKVRVVAIWFLLSRAEAIYSTFTSFVSSAALMGHCKSFNFNTTLSTFVVLDVPDLIDKL
jgi:hypothetical protein